MKNPSTIVDKDIFVGRLSEQTQFRGILRSVLQQSSAVQRLKNWLLAERSDVQPHIVLIQGEGGIGKSAMIRRFRDIAELEAPFAYNLEVFFLDWEIERFHSIELQANESGIKADVIFKRIYNFMIEKGWEKAFREYRSVSKLLNRSEQKVSQALVNETANTVVRDLGAEAIAAIVRRGLGMGDRWQGSMAKGTATIIQSGAEKLSQIHIWLREKVRLSSEEYDIFCQPYENLARALGRGFAHVARKRPVVVCFDTYDIVLFSDPWIRTAIKSSGPYVVWIIASNNNLSKTQHSSGFIGYSAEFSHKLSILELPELAIDHVVEYLKGRSPSEDFERKDAELLHRLSFGIPLALEQATDLWLQDATTLSKIDHRDTLEPRNEIANLMSQRLMANIVNQQEQRVLFVLVMQRRPDPFVQTSVLKDNYPQVGLANILETLESKYSMIKTIGGARIHESVSKFMREYLLSPERRSSEEVQLIVSRAIDACQTRKAQIEESLVSIDDRFVSEDWKDVALDIVYWLFWKNEYAAWTEFIPRFIEGLGYSHQLAEGLLAIADDLWSTMGKDGQRKLQVLKEGISGDVEGTQTMIAELERYLDSKSLDTNEQKAILILKQGRLALASGQYDSAASLYEQVESFLSVSTNKLRLQLADAYAELGWRTASSAAFRRSLDLSYTDANYLFILGRKRLRSRDYAQAIAAYERLISLIPNDFFFYAALGFTYRHIGDHISALGTLVKAIELNPNDEFSRLGLGNTYAALGKNQEAQQVFEEILILNPKSATAHSSMARIYQKLRKINESEYHKQQARMLFNSPYYFLKGSHYNLACFESICGNYDKALLELQEAIKNSPDLRDLAKFDLDFDEMHSDKLFQELINN